MTTSPEKLDVLYRNLSNGCTMAESARRAGIPLRSAYRLGGRQSQVNGRTAQENKAQRQFAVRPIPVSMLSEEAKKGLTDFGHFQRRIFGCIPIYWQDRAAEQVLELLESPNKEFVDINCPPGAGKTSLFMCRIPAWMTCRRRSIRGLMGSATAPLAAKSTRLLRKELQRHLPILARSEDVQKGTALNAITTMSHDYGRFKPIQADIWQAEAFTVMQHQGGDLAEKEYTWQTVSRDREFIGGRFDAVLWDDLQTLKRLRQEELILADREWWDTVAEARVEPSGLLILQGQRLGANDIHRYNLDKLGLDDEDDDEDEPESDDLRAVRFNFGAGSEPVPKKYTHIVFKAHYEELCSEGSHKRSAPAYGEGGCLLYPARLPWRDLRIIQRNSVEAFEVAYQQQDTDPEHVLVKMDWVAGTNGHPGCWDLDRDRLELPKGLMPPLVSVMSVDPSATKWWALEWWVYHPASEQRFLMDLLRVKMDAPSFLDWDENNRVFSGACEEWWQTSVSLGIPITHLVVEANACQRYLLQYQHTHRWVALRGVEIIPHTTHLNKSDPEYGLQMLAPHYRFGRVRLPGKGNIDGISNLAPGRVMSLKLIGEATRYPRAETTDCLMAQWFFEYQLPNIYVPEAEEGAGQESRPSWMRPPPPVEGIPAWKVPA